MDVVEPAPSIALTCAQDGQWQDHDLPVTSLRFAPDAGAVWLELEESGQSVVLVSPTADAIDISSPYRYGWHWRHVDAGHEIDIQRFDPNVAPAHVKVSLHCSLPPALQPRLLWLQQASSIAARLQRPVEPSQLPSLLSDIDRLTMSADDDQRRAMGLHLRAQALAVNGRSADAVQAFAVAEQSWQAIRDPARALAARVGRVEELYATGDSRSVLALTDGISDSSNATYFSVRLANTRCLVLQAQAKLDDAEHCYDWVLAQYQRLGENTERVTSLQNYASLLRDQGKPDKAWQLGQAALASARGPNAPMVRGRLHVMLGNLAILRGDVAEALSQSDLALDEFAHARENVLRWEANTYLNAAFLFAQLGADSEAYDALGQAISRISVRDAPARMAVAMNVFADVERDTHNLESAILWKYAAEQIFTGLNMPAAAEGVRAERLGVEIDAGGFNPSETEITQRLANNSASAPDWQLLSAELAVQQNRQADARLALNGARSGSMSLPQQIRAIRLDARLHFQTGDATGAQQILLAAAGQSEALLGKTGSPVIRYLVSKQIRMIGKSAFQQILARRDSTTEVAATLSWLAFMTDDGARIENLQSAKHAKEFDRAVAEDLLTPAKKNRTEAESKTQRELLALLATNDDHADQAGSSVRSISLAAISQNLDADSVFVAYVDGETRGGLLWVSRDDARLLGAAAPEDVRTSIAALREA
ncbi:MAG TPA: tetratricopeptide repeat protein, partial [Rudaea sp.]|uniref:tetratricopeptide repeat protein n=1 Tax=Rudaea sp. TaxID=2136325 RepID=UPI002F94B883